MPEQLDSMPKLVTNTHAGPIIGKLPVKSHPDAPQNVKIVTLHADQHLDSTLYRLEKGWIVEFRLGPSLLGKQINIFCNHPANIENEFQRHEYCQLEWQYRVEGQVHNKNCNDDTAMFAHLVIRRAGSFHYYFTDEDCSVSKQSGSGYFTVDPVLTFGSDIDEVLPLDSIQCQTVLAKSLGLLKEWENRLRVSKESGYNMIHFTPVQALGASNSSYSLKDQLALNETFSSKGVSHKFEDILTITQKMRQEWRVLSICDIVLNHTANESPWLVEHPECTYNMITAPHLIPAAILDAHLHLMTVKASRGDLNRCGIPPEVYTHDHVNAIRHYLQTELVPSLRLEELYICDVDRVCEEFKEAAKKRGPSDGGPDRAALSLIPDVLHRRKKATVDLELALNVFNVHRNDTQDDESRLLKCIEDLRRRLEELNLAAKTELSHHLSAAVDNCIANICYFRLQDDGPKLREVSEGVPLVPRYFTGKYLKKESVEHEIYSEGQFVMAHNGWVMNSDPLKNFAESDSNVYIRRELIAWGDSVKLRYGDSPSDCPFLWDHMRKYVEQTAVIFDGVRLDNCHSTPLPVAEYLLDHARKLRPDLYVVAELFTNSDTTDNIFVNRLGITSLIREAMSAWDSHELGRLVYRYGGDPAGGFCSAPVRPLIPSIAHALLMDVTHDNPSPIQKKSVFDTMATSALVAMAACASGSSRGYDELVPHHIHVVDETRKYTSWTDDEAVDVAHVNIKTGIIAVKKALNALHTELSQEGFSQIFVDQMSEDVVAVTRHNPLTHHTVILVAYTAFSSPPRNPPRRPDIKNLRVEGRLSEIILEAGLRNRNADDPFTPPGDFQQNEKTVNGLTQYNAWLKRNITIEESTVLKQVDSGNDKVSQFEFQVFQPGSVVAVRVVPHPSVKPALEALSQLAESLVKLRHGDVLTSIVAQLNLNDLNHALYRCSQEDIEEGTGAYHVPGYGSLVYCGLQGFASVLSEIAPGNDLGHPVCQNLRQGDWMLDYVIGRLKSEKGTLKLGLWLHDQFELVRQVPRYLIPRYFEVIITAVHQLLLSRAAFQMSQFVRDGSTFVRALALGSVQCTGVIESAPLPPFSPFLDPKEDEKRKLTLSAGLPHFATGYMRSWGRDTFIALRGLLILTGRFQEARYHILGYASCLRHGLIPNLLDRGVNARYNCRDAVWWWLHSILSYIELAPNGSSILKDPVSRIFPRDDSPPMGPGVVEQPLHDVIQEALAVHFQGLSFRERNAGSKIDAHMTDPGFNNSVGVDLETGFIYGGNEFNCGTWMDKMGSSFKAGSKGRPATPRDGSAVELVALCKAVLRDLNQLHQTGRYPYQSVERFDRDGKVTTWTFKEWEEKIESNFEKHFWVSENVQPGERTELIHRRGIYKDSVGATQPWADYQLRCNFPIALVVAPEMLDPHKAWTAICKAEELLLGPLGMKTLDPGDWNYNGDYHNDDDSNDPKVAHGFNYHQGPEWIWPVGFFLRAKLHFAKLIGNKELRQAITQTRSYLSAHYKEAMTTHWRGLPELTNKNGAYCSDSCRVQAWSMACILEVLFDLNSLEKTSRVATVDSSCN